MQEHKRKRRPAQAHLLTPKRIKRLTYQDLAYAREHGHIQIDGRLYKYDKSALARVWGNAHGYRGGRGGWVYKADNKKWWLGTPIIQGWGNFYEVFAPAINKWVQSLCKPKG